MTDLRTAALMALDAFDNSNHMVRHANSRVIEALRVALAQGEQKPVAWIYDFPNPDDPAEVVRDWTAFSLDDVKRDNGINVRPLYLAPPTREWQGLTDEEIAEAMVFNKRVMCAHIEAKLKEKNK